MTDGLSEKLFQVRDGSIGIGIGLKIGDKLMHRTFLGDQRLLLFDLLGDGQKAICGEIAGAAGAAGAATAGAPASTSSTSTSYTLPFTVTLNFLMIDYLLQNYI